MSQFSFEAIGTKWQIDSTIDLPIELIQEIKSRLHLFENTYSRFRAGSFVMQMTQSAGTYVLPPDAQQLFDVYYKLYCITAGSFTPFIGQALVDAGYDDQYSLQPKSMQPVVRWDEVAVYSFPHFTITQPVQLDFGAAGKGWSIDIVAEILKKGGVDEFCIDAGGDIRYENKTQDLRVGLENPQDTTQVIGVATIRNQSICGSAGNRRNWGQFHHILDPHRLVSPDHILATWVIAESTMLADALATCLYFVPARKLAEEYKFEYLIIYADLSLERSANFPGEIFIQT